MRVLLLFQISMFWPYFFKVNNSYQNHTAVASNGIRRTYCSLELISIKCYGFGSADYFSSTPNALVLADRVLTWKRLFAYKTTGFPYRNRFIRKVKILISWELMPTILTIILMLISAAKDAKIIIHWWLLLSSFLSFVQNWLQRL